MDDELIEGWIEGSSRLEASYKRRVTELSLTVSTEYPARSGERKPFGLLLFDAVVFDGRLEQDSLMAERISFSQSMNSPCDFPPHLALIRL